MRGVRRIAFCSGLVLILFFLGVITISTEAVSADQGFSGNIKTTTKSTVADIDGFGHALSTTSDESGTFTFTIESDDTVTGSGTGTSTVTISGTCNGERTFSSTIDVSGRLWRDANGNPLYITLSFDVHTPADSDGQYHIQNAECSVKTNGPLNPFNTVQLCLANSCEPSSDFKLNLQNGASDTQNVPILGGSGQTTVTISGALLGLTPQPSPPPQPTQQCNNPDQIRDQNGNCVNIPATFSGPATQVVGDVKVQLSDGSWKQVKEGDVISNVQTIKTGPNSWITINSIKTSPTSFDNSMLALGENTEFQPGQNPKLIQGYLWIYETHSKGSNCNVLCSVIGSLLAKIDVKGTDFITSYDPHSNVQYVALKEGSIDVTLLSINQTFHYVAPWFGVFNSTNVASGTLDQNYWNNQTGLFPFKLDSQTPQQTLSTAKSIPSWIKNNAKWWHDGAIGDDEFTKGIQYMIQNGIMTIPQTQSGSSSSQSIPSWIKNNAGWWADGKISDDEFVKGIQWLVSNGMIKA